MQSSLGPSQRSRLLARQAVLVLFCLTARRVAGQTNIANDLPWPPGQAIWLVSRQPVKQVFHLFGEVPRQDVAPIPIRPGYNLIGYPYPADALWVDTTLAQAAGEFPASMWLWQEDGSFATEEYFPPDYGWIPGTNRLATGQGGIYSSDDAGLWYEPMPYYLAGFRTLAGGPGSLTMGFFFSGISVSPAGVLRLEWVASPKFTNSLDLTHNLASAAFYSAYANVPAHLPSNVFAGTQPPFPFGIYRLRMESDGGGVQLGAEVTCVNMVGFRRFELPAYGRALVVNVFQRPMATDPPTLGDILERQLTGAERPEFADRIEVADSQTGELTEYWKHVSGDWYRMGANYPTNQFLPAATADVMGSSGIFSNRIEVLWSRVPGADSYEVWRAESNQLSSAVLLTNTAAAVFDDWTARGDGTYYYYWIRATNACGAGRFSVSCSGYRQSRLITLYVNPAGGAVRPYTNWTQAATTITQALGVARSGHRILVAAGTYTTPLDVPSGVAVESSAGPETTIIDGRGSGKAVVRLNASYATLAGFTVRGGAAGGVWCTIGTRVRNCIVTANSNISGDGGGVLCYVGGTVENCVISSNRAARGGGIYCHLGGAVLNCRILGNEAEEGHGGGAYVASGGHVANSTVMSNVAAAGGGGLYLHAGAEAAGCVSAGNSAASGGGVFCHGGALRNATVTANSASQGGGVYWENGGEARNSILFANTAPSGSNYFHSGTAPRYVNCCVAPDPGGASTVSRDPAFRQPTGFDFRLLAVSPCIDAGRNEAWMPSRTDCDSNPRIFNGTVDIGAYEFTMRTFATAFLAGAWDAVGHGLRTTLRAQGSLPEQAPYAAARARLSATATNLCDWALIELSPTNRQAQVATASALLRDDGELVGEDGSAGVRIEVAPGFYYLSVKHRNHLAAMSASPIAFTNDTVTWNFATGPNKYMGGTNGCVELESGVWGLIAGDADGDGEVTEVDRAIVAQQMGKTGYLSGDLNLDGVVMEDD